MKFFIGLLAFGAIFVGCPAQVKKTETMQQTLKQSFEDLIGTKVASEESIEFDREKMTTLLLEEEAMRKKLFKKKTNLVEGYWRWKPEETPEGEGYPWPVAHDAEFAGKEAFLKKLDKVESMSKIGSLTYLKSGAILEGSGMLGYSHCRFDGKKNEAGETNLYLGDHAIYWPAGYRHYIAQHNVIPSREFYRFVMNLDLSIEKSRL